MDTRAYKPHTLVGPPVRRLVLAPLAAHTSTIVYVCQVISGRQTKFEILKSNRLEGGANALCCRLNILNKMFPLTLLDLSMDSLRVNFYRVKEVFLWVRHQGPGQ